MKKKGFTLVELIVVVTILAILATVGFISYSWYVIDSRNSKRTSDITNITQQVELWILSWKDLFSFVANSWSRITENIKISWRIWTWITIDEYNAWDINATALWLNDDIILDPLWVSWYKIWVVDINWAFYEVAWTLEKDWDLDAYVKWTWHPREQIKFDRDWDAAHSDVYTIIPSKDFNIRVWDIVQINTWKYEVLNIKDNKLYLDRVVDPTWSRVFLPNNESVHLIKKWSSSDYPIQEWKWASYVPYLLDK